MLGEPLPDRLEPGIAVVVVRERHPQALRQSRTDGRFTGARTPMTTIGDAILSPYLVVLDVTQNASKVIRLQLCVEIICFLYRQRSYDKMYAWLSRQTSALCTAICSPRWAPRSFPGSTRPGRCSRSTGSARGTACPAASPSRRSASWSRWEWSNRDAG